MGPEPGRRSAKNSPGADSAFATSLPASVTLAKAAFAEADVMEPFLYSHVANRFAPKYVLDIFW